MGKNIVIFSDGTGNSSGIYLDENRTNIYKLFRATRSGPDSPVKPTDQVAFYDPGVGTSRPGTTSLGQWKNWFVDFIGKATGLGLTTNVIDCYAALIRLWEPGDRIFLFGFSRGAYTVRLLGGVIALCGIPTGRADGQDFDRSEKASNQLAREAVVDIYQHASSKPPGQAEGEAKFLRQRALLAGAYRRKYLSDVDHGPNVSPHFIGVFDTVSSLLHWKLMTVLGGLAIGIMAVFSWCAARATEQEFWPWFLGLGIWMAILFLIWMLGTYLKTPGALSDHKGVPKFRWWETIRLNFGAMKFDDFTLGRNVGVARHALSVDERRAQFVHVLWKGYVPEQRSRKTSQKWVEQRWFAGVHSDIGGGYPENYSRLSDVALCWMIGEAKAAGLIVDEGHLQLSPDPLGSQHDETKTSIFRFLEKKDRDISNDAILDPSVTQRIAHGSVLQGGISKPYRPTPLKAHPDVEEIWS